MKQMTRETMMVLAAALALAATATAPRAHAFRSCAKIKGDGYHACDAIQKKCNQEKDSYPERKACFLERSAHLFPRPECLAGGELARACESVEAAKCPQIGPPTLHDPGRLPKWKARVERVLAIDVKAPLQLLRGKLAACLSEEARKDHQVSCPSDEQIARCERGTESVVAAWKEVGAQAPAFVDKAIERAKGYRAEAVKRAEGALKTLRAMAALGEMAPLKGQGADFKALADRLEAEAAKIEGEQKAKNEADRAAAMAGVECPKQPRLKGKLGARAKKLAKSLRKDILGAIGRKGYEIVDVKRHIASAAIARDVKVVRSTSRRFEYLGTTTCAKAVREGKERCFVFKTSLEQSRAVRGGGWNGWGVELVRPIEMSCDRY